VLGRRHLFGGDAAFTKGRNDIGGFLVSCPGRDRLVERVVVSWQIGSAHRQGRRAAVFVTQARRVIATEKYFDEEAVSLLLTKDAAVLLRECVDFLAPHLAAAKLTGEVRKDLDIQASGEWFARILFSLFSTPSSTLNMDDPDVVADFVRAHVVRGFANERPKPRRTISP
jgi:hypothetical protein